jgi:ATP synthase protein I
MTQNESSVWRELARLSSVGVTFGAAVAIGLFMGYGLDRLVGTSPWLTIVFALFGIAAGFLNFFREVGLIGRKRP